MSVEKEVSKETTAHCQWCPHYSKRNCREGGLGHKTVYTSESGGIRNACQWSGGYRHALNPMTTWPHGTLQVMNNLIRLLYVNQTRKKYICSLLSVSLFTNPLIFCHIRVNIEVQLAHRFSINSSLLGSMLWWEPGLFVMSSGNSFKYDMLISVANVRFCRRPFKNFFELYLIIMFFYYLLIITKLNLFRLRYIV